MAAVTSAGGEVESPDLGRIEPVDIRLVWPHEALSFTPWLLANADRLGEVLGLDLALSAAEHPVGGYSLDLIGVDQASGDRVIVENQLTPTDHTHLGQVLTYAGGTDPVNVVWIATSFREEHRAALDWLNARTDEDTRFFGVQLSVVRIGGSLPAPLLRLVAQPNDWGKRVMAGARSQSVSAKALAYEQFWTELLDQLRARSLPWTKSRKGHRQNWIGFTSGSSGIVFNCSYTRLGLCSEIYFEDPDATVNEARFSAAQARRQMIDAAYGEPLQYEPLPDRKGCRIAAYREGRIGLSENWPDYIEWFVASQMRLRTAMSELVGLAAGG